MASSTHEQSKRKRKPNIEGEVLEKLIAYYEAGMQSTRTQVRKSKVSEAARDTGLHEEVIKNWMSNHRSKEKRISEKSVTNEKPVTFKKKKKRLTGYDVYKCTFLTEKPGQLSEAEQARREVPEEEKDRLASAAKEEMMAPGPSPDELTHQKATAIGNLSRNIGEDEGSGRSVSCPPPKAM